MKWNPQQENALQAVDKWFYTESKKKKIFRIFGYAGSGKTTLAKHFAENIDGDVFYAAFTGKAALMMQKNGCVGASTIHRLIYRIEEDGNGDIKFKLNRGSEVKNAALIIIDECSMVDEQIANDLLSFGKPILVLGDPAQLPPVSGAGYFTNAKPDIMLTEIHRQAKDNPIIYLATEVRNGRKLKIGSYGESQVLRDVKPQMIVENDQIIVGKNATRTRLNSIIRKDFLNIDYLTPVIEDKLICLKNDYDLGIFNGGMFIVSNIFKSANENKVRLEVAHEEEDNNYPILVDVHKSFFDPSVQQPHYKILNTSQQFDYGYAITCHKSQGSQWDDILVYDESKSFRDMSDKWLYTAITRAANKITIISD